MAKIDKVTVKVFRYDPSRDKEPRYETYEVPYFEGMRVLDVLLYIVDYLGEDIAFRWSCGSARCGTCAMLVNGKPKLTCFEPAEKEMVIEPLPNFPIIRDLVVDTSGYYKRLLNFIPYLKRKPKSDNRSCIKCHQNLKDTLKSYANF